MLRDISEQCSLITVILLLLLLLLRVVVVMICVSPLLICWSWITYSLDYLFAVFSWVCLMPLDQSLSSIAFCGGFVDNITLGHHGLSYFLHLL